MSDLGQTVSRKRKKETENRYSTLPEDLEVGSRV